MTKKQHINKLRKQMTALGTYRPEYQKTIEIAADLLAQFEVLSERFVAEDMPFQVATDSGVKKAPIVTTLEALRRDIMTYLSALGLTPAAASRMEVQKPEQKNVMAEVLARLEADD